MTNITSATLCKIHYGKDKPNTKECYFDNYLEEWVESDSAQIKRIKEVIKSPIPEPKIINIDFKLG